MWPERLVARRLTLKGTKAHVVKPCADARALWCVDNRRTVMRAALALTLIILASNASAHTGHLGEVAGHDHWIAGAALGLALGLALWAALKGKKDTDKEPSEDEIEETEGETA